MNELARKNLRIASLINQLEVVNSKLEDSEKEVIEWKAMYLIEKYGYLDEVEKLTYQLSNAFGIDSSKIIDWFEENDCWNPYEPDLVNWIVS